ncbi:MAG: nitric oxide reductase [Cytophagales bacterium]|nr:nitric oxide reductase [Cytophagales bacterium]
MEITNNKSFYYPPGGILIWIVVFLELVTFSMALLVFMSQRQTDLQLFSESQKLLNTTLGMLNTITLLTSGLFMATGLSELKSGNQKKAVLYLWLTIGLGILFMALKAYEYYEKFQLETSVISNEFFMFYWFITGFHFLHVLVAVVLLSFMLAKTKSGSYTFENFEDVESVGIFWHMCDLIWIVVFPVIYLLH